MKIIRGKLYRVPELCEMLGVARQTIYRWIDSGKLKAIPHQKKMYRRVMGRDISKFLGGK